MISYDSKIEGNSLKRDFEISNNEPFVITLFFPKGWIVIMNSAKFAYKKNFKKFRTPNTYFLEFQLNGL